MSMDPNDFLMGGGGVPSFSFGPIGAPPGIEVSGKILDLKTSQQTKFQTREPLTWPNGDPKMQLEITLQTTLRDPTIEDDDGQRRVFIKGRNMTNAVREAVQAIGAKGLERGGSFWMKWTRNGEASAGNTPPREYECKVTRPNDSAAFLSTTEPEPAQQPATPAQNGNSGSSESALQAALANLSPEVKAALLAQAGK